MKFFKTKKNNAVLYTKIMYLSTLFGLLMLVITAGCSNQQSIENYAINVAEDTEITRINDTVSLKNIKGPSYGKIFFMISPADDQDDVICINFASGNNFLWYTSGYPGFGLPMVIELKSSFKSGNVKNLLITTDYGQFEYKLKSTGMAYVNDDQLIDSDTAECVVQFGSDEEDVVLYNSKSEKYYLYIFSEGTHIVSSV